MIVSAAQLNLKHCFSKKQFIDYLEEQIFQKLITVPDIICFPENINYCLLFAKKETISSLSIKKSFENIFDKIISKLDLSFVFRFLNIKNQENIILDSMSFLAHKYNCHIITGTYYEKRSDGIYNSLSIIDNNGEILGTASKRDLVGFEKALKLQTQHDPVVVETRLGEIGLCVCYDLDNSYYISKFKKEGANILFAPSNGWRPFPGYPFDYKKETPQIERAKENGFSIVRPYCAGWMFPLYFQGHTQIVDALGNIVAKSSTYNKSEIVTATLIR
jgi:predicted amidohydrolase